MGDEKQVTLVVRKDCLFGKDNQDYFTGFRQSGEMDYTSRIFAHYNWMCRGEAEHAEHYKHPIPYMLVVNPTTKKIFAFQRANKHDEQRLKDRWSFGVGGHIDFNDSNSHTNPIDAALYRELNEEVEMDGVVLSKILLGSINDDSDAVGQVHLGLLYAVLTDSNEARPKDKGMSQGRFHDLGELINMCGDPQLAVENWSRIAIDPLRIFLKQAC